MQVHTMEGGSHSLRVPGGKDKADKALEAAIAAACTFLGSLESKSSAQTSEASAKGKHGSTADEQKQLLAENADMPSSKQTGSGKRKRAKTSE